MNKNKKLIALISALAMIFSLFTSLVVVRAEGQGVKLVYDAANSTETTTYLNVVAEGYATLESYTMVISEFPSEITAAVKESSLLDGEENFEDGTFLFSGSASNAKAVPADGVILKIKLTGKVTDNFNVQIGGTSTITGYDKDNTKVKLTSKSGSLVSEATEVPVWTDPNKTPEPTDTPEPTPVSTKAPKITQAPATEAPATEAPALKTPEPVEVTQGVVLETTTESATTAYVTVKAVDYDTLESYTMVISGFPETVTAAVKESALLDGEENFEDGTFLFSGSSSNAKAVPSNGEILKIKLTGTFDDDFVVSVGGTSTITGYKGENKVKLTSKSGQLPSAWTVVESFDTPVETTTPTATPTPIPQKATTVKASEQIDTSKITDETKDADGDSNYRLGVKVLDKSGNDVTESGYGDKTNGYVATVTDKNGKDVELTKDQFSNLVNGYISELPEEFGITDMKTAIAKLNLVPYNTGMEITLQAIDEDDKVVDGGTAKPADIGGGTTPTGTTPYVTAATPISAFSNSSVTVTAKINNYKAANGNKKLTYRLVKNARGDEFGVEGVSSPIYFAEDSDLEYNTYDVNSETMGVLFRASYTSTGAIGYVKISYIDDTMTTPSSVVVTVRVSANDGTTTYGGTGSGSTYGSGNGGGALASANQQGTNDGSTFITFNDLDQAEWARPAITALSLRDIISGRGDGTFDPNANITRAEYCQIVVNTIESIGDYADASFDDVPTDAWFYHAIAVAQNLGIVSGFGDGTFRPYELITREQMALMTQKAAQVKNFSLAPVQSVSFSDDAEIGDWAKTAVYELSNAGIINGMGDGSFAPKANATRAQACVIIYNTFLMDR